MNSVTCITINTDASFHPQHKVGGYAFYTVCDRFRMKHGGIFKKHPLHAQQAEIMCIGNAIAALLALSDLPATQHLVINNDCMWGMRTIQQGSSPLGKTVLELHQQLLKRLGDPVHAFRHVKAHSRKKDSRSWVNEWCDGEAKKWMRMAAAVKQQEDESSFNKNLPGV